MPQEDSERQPPHRAEPGRKKRANFALDRRVRRALQAGCVLTGLRGGLVGIVRPLPQPLRRCWHHGVENHGQQRMMRSRSHIGKAAGPASKTGRWRFTNDWQERWFAVPGTPPVTTKVRYRSLKDSMESERTAYQQHPVHLRQLDYSGTPPARGTSILGCLK